MDFTSSKSTGIEWLDELLSGGFSEGSTNLFTGDIGTGKTIFAISFLAEGVKNGEKCVYISTTTETARLRKYLVSLKFLPKNILDEIEWIDFTPTPRDIFPVGKDKVEKLFVEYFKVETADRLVLDNYTSLERLIHDPSFSREFLFQMIRILSEKKVTSVIVEEEVKAEALAYDQHRFFADSVIRFVIIPLKNGYVRALRILKLYGKEHLLEYIPFEITSDSIRKLPGKIVEFGDKKFVKVE